MQVTLDTTPNLLVLWARDTGPVDGVHETALSEVPSDQEVQKDTEYWSE